MNLVNKVAEALWNSDRNFFETFPKGERWKDETLFERTWEELEGYEKARYQRLARAAIKGVISHQLSTTTD